LTGFISLNWGEGKHGNKKLKGEEENKLGEWKVSRKKKRERKIP